MKPAAIYGRAVLLIGVGLMCAASVTFAAEKGTKTQVNSAGATKADTKRAEARTNDADEGGEAANVDGKKAKVLTFGAMDVEGKMRTPQLLFFLGRVKAELDSSSQLKRSFIKELKATSKEKGL